MTAHQIARTTTALALIVAGVMISARVVDAATKYGASLSSSHSAVARGKYLVTVASCTDCHTPGHFFGKEDATKFLGGSDVGFAIPGLGVFVGPNLTPDKDTGLGDMTTEQIVTAMTTGKLPDGRMLAPIMPYAAYANLSKSDAQAIALYLESLPPVKNKVAGPFGPTQKPTVFVMAVIPGDVYSGLPAPPPPRGASTAPGTAPPPAAK